MLYCHFCNDSFGLDSVFMYYKLCEHMWVPPQPLREIISLDSYIKVNTFLLTHWQKVLIQEAQACRFFVFFFPGALHPEGELTVCSDYDNMRGNPRAFASLFSLIEINSCKPREICSGFYLRNELVYLYSTRCHKSA